MAATMANSSDAASSAMMPRKSSASGGGGGADGGGNGVQMRAPVHPSPHGHSHNDGRGSGGSTASAMSISSKPTPITTPTLRFLIMDAPRQSNLHLYIKECRRHHVTDIVRVCEPTYLGGELAAAGMRLHEMAYDDGQSPPEDVLGRWLALVEERFAGPTKDRSTVAVHCVAGLGRAPVLVAIALMEFEGMDAVEAVVMIRGQRRGAINEKQLRYLESYRCRRKSARGGCACVIM